MYDQESKEGDNEELAIKIRAATNEGNGKKAKRAASIRDAKISNEVQSSLLSSSLLLSWQSFLEIIMMVTGTGLGARKTIVAIEERISSIWGTS